jgi:fatty-acyl-CoA synthase
MVFALEREIIMFCRDKLPHYMVSRSVVFSELPKTSTGKIQKFVFEGEGKGNGQFFLRR